MPETGIPHIDSALVSRTVASGMLGFFNFFTLFFPIYVLEELFGSTVAPLGFFLVPIFGALSYYVPIVIFMRGWFANASPRARYRLVTWGFAFYLVVWGVLWIWSATEFEKRPL